MIAGLAILGCICVLMGIVAAIAACVERLPHYPPLYDDSDVLPAPELRTQRYQPHPESEWIIEE